MGLFSFTQEIAIDLGTANTLIMCNDKVVVNEPSVVAISMTDNKCLAVGKKAQQMIGRGAMMAGLLVGAGVGLLVLFRTNKNRMENLKITAMLYVIGVLGGIIINIFDKLW